LTTPLCCCRTPSASSRGRPAALFLFTDTAATAIYTLSLHDALPILRCDVTVDGEPERAAAAARERFGRLDVVVANAGFGVVGPLDRKSTRLNSSHGSISYAVFCLKKKKTRDIKWRRFDGWSWRVCST